MSRVLVEPHHLLSQTSRMICSRVTTFPASFTSTHSRSNSLVVSSSSVSPIQARRASGSTRTPCTVLVSTLPRRSRARTRARSSASRNGLVT
jgi:hypothetical protein